MRRNVRPSKWGREAGHRQTGKMSEALKHIKDQQRKWAGEENISPKGYRRKLRDNLFQNLDKRTRREFERADGNELYGNMNAIHSSSALACNFFDYWRGVEKASSLAEALKFYIQIIDIKFEEKFEHGLCSKRPNIDVVLTGSNRTILAIESKFAEHFDGPKNKKIVKSSYFSGGREGDSGRWSQLGLSGCQKLAESLREKHCYKHLDAAQLLKHMLGLANFRGTGDPMCYKNWTLLYLWFNPGGPEADRHEDEIEKFTKAVRRADGKVGDHGEFRTMTYQELFEKLSRKLDDSHEEYREYLAQRYFPKK